MALVVPRSAEVKALTAWLATGKQLKLFTNNVTPGQTDVAATFTEAAGNGYAAKALTGGAWTMTEGVGAPSSAAYAQQIFTFTGALGNVYGYYVVETSDGTICWAERFTDGPYNIQNNGDQIKVTPAITQD